MNNLTAIPPSSPSLSVCQAVLVQFPASDPDLPGASLVFGSLAALFEMFSESALGVSLAALYALRLSDGSAFTSSSGVRIQKVPVYRKKQRSPS